MRLPTLTGEFRLGADPELKFTPSGKAVCDMSLICTESKNVGTPQTPQWEDGDSTPWIRVSIWGQAAEGCAESLTKGERVLVTGLLYVREWEARDGTKGQSVELKYATVAPIPGGKPRNVTRTNRPDANDPWAADTGSQDRDPWSTQDPGGRTRTNAPSNPWGSDDEPPF